jgi:predicted transcriptional regulator
MAARPILSTRAKRSKSLLAAAATAVYGDSEGWQFGALQVGIAEVESGQEISHERVSKWLNSWGKPGETKAPR